MREQVANRHVRREVRIGELEFGQMLDDRIVPFELAVINERGQAGGGERFGAGGDGEAGVGRDLAVRAELADAVAAGEDDFAVFDDGQGHAGGFPAVHGGSDVGIEPGEAVVGSGRCNEQQQNGQQANIHALSRWED